MVVATDDWTDFIAEVRDNFREEINRSRPTRNSIDRYVSEEADAVVNNLGTVQVLELALANTSLATEHSEMPSERNAIDLIKWAIYDEVQAALYREWNEAKEYWKSMEQRIWIAVGELEDYLEKNRKASQADIQEFVDTLLEEFPSEDLDLWEEVTERFEETITFHRHYGGIDTYA